MLAAGLSLAIGLAPVADKVLAAVIAAAGAILFARGTRAAIWVSERGVTAADGRVTRHLAWSDVRRFELDPEDREGLMPGTGLGAWRHNGEWVRLMAHGRDPKGRYRAALEDLQAELARRQP
jgi:hypothetical protein